MLEAPQRGGGGGGGGEERVYHVLEAPDRGGGGDAEDRDYQVLEDIGGGAQSYEVPISSKPQTGSPKAEPDYSKLQHQ